MGNYFDDDDLECIWDDFCDVLPSDSKFFEICEENDDNQGVYFVALSDDMKVCFDAFREYMDYLITAIVEYAGYNVDDYKFIHYEVGLEENVTLVENKIIPD